MERRLRSPRSRDSHLGVAASLSNPALRAVAAAVAALALGGCSLSFPVRGTEPDSTPTGSIDRAAASFPAALGPEDLRGARAALAATLDPQGNGATAAWRNPQTGARGAFTAEGSPFPEEDRVCRRFRGDIVAAGGGERHVSGSACREGDGSWRVRGEGPSGV